MNTLDYIVSKFKLDVSVASPIEIPEAGRINLAQWLADLNFKVGVEVGVAEGEYSEIICKANPQMKVYGVDPYESYDGYADYDTTEELQVLYQQAKNRLSKFPRYIFLKEFSVNALKRFSDKSIDFVYIDANHEDPYVTWDVEGWSKKIKPGGILAGHDYSRKATAAGFNVVETVNRHARDNDINPWFTLKQKDYSPSWMWVYK